MLAGDELSFKRIHSEYHWLSCVSTVTLILVGVVAVRSHLWQNLQLHAHPGPSGKKDGSAKTANLINKENEDCPVKKARVMVQ